MSTTARQSAKLMFMHQRSWRKGQLLWGLGAMVFLAPMLLAAYFVSDFGWVFLLMSVPLLAVMAQECIQNRAVTGEWRIQVTQTEVTWKTPQNFHFRQGFRVRICDIKAVVSEKTGRGSDSTRQYTIVMANDDYCRLDDIYSGIDFEGFCKVLQKLGVNYCKHP